MKTTGCDNSKILRIDFELMISLSFLWQKQFLLLDVSLLYDQCWDPVYFLRKNHKSKTIHSSDKV
jgi:hypothetical protein